jgi:hypothetical protein
MGDFRLGCLLGQYDGAQSFDVDSVAITGATFANSWSRSTFANSTFYDVEVHSSDQGIKTDIWSASVFGVIFNFYDYNRSNDYQVRKFSDVISHNVVFDIWARLTKAFSGSIQVRGVGDNLNINQSSELEYYRIEGGVSSSAGINAPGIEFYVTSFVDSVTIYIDDVLAQVDPITLYPEISFKEQAQIIKTDHVTRGGERHTHVWGKNFNYSVPLRYISDSHANLINWWWENKFALAFTLDTSESESTYIVRIANNSQPIGKRVKPYQDKWEGLLQLESIDDGSLVF